MNKLNKIAIPLLALFAACGEESSAVRVPTVSSVDDLPECTSQNEGDLRFVESKNMTYTCRDSSWIHEEEQEWNTLSSTSQDRTNSSSSASRESSSSLARSSSSVSSSSVKSSSSMSSSSEEFIPGKVIKGAHYGLDFRSETPNVKVRALNEKLEFIDSTVVYTGTLELSTGAFVVRGLPEDIALAEIRFWGNVSSSALSSYYRTDTAYVNLQGVDSLYVNNGLVMLAQRIKYLVQEQNLPFGEAKHQAESEMQKPFYAEDKFHDLEKINVLKDTTDGGLWAATISTFRDNLRNYYISEEFVKNGTVEFPYESFARKVMDCFFDSQGYFGAIYNGASAASKKGIRERVTALVDSVTGRGACTKERQNEFFTYKDTTYRYWLTICDKAEWRTTTTLEKDTRLWENPCTVGTLKFSDSTYSYNTRVYYCNASRKWIDALRLDPEVPRDAYLNPDVEYGTMTDNRDGKTYKTVKIGNKTWMAQNLDFRGYSDGSPVDSALKVNVGNGRACYDKQTSYCDLCGSMYSWSAAMNINKRTVLYDTAVVEELIREPHQGVCPDGWHIPTYDEYKNILMDELGVGSDQAGKYLKARAGWSRVFRDSIGFTALPCGRHWYASNISNYTFEDMGYDSYYYAYKGIKQVRVRFGPKSEPYITLDTPSYWEHPRYYPDYHSYIRCIKDD